MNALYVSRTTLKQIVWNVASPDGESPPVGRPWCTQCAIGRSLAGEGSSSSAVDVRKYDDASPRIICVGVILLYRCQAIPAAHLFSEHS